MCRSELLNMKRRKGIMYSLFKRKNKNNTQACFKVQPSHLKSVSPFMVSIL